MDLIMGGPSSASTNRRIRRRDAIVDASFGAGSTHMVKGFRSVALSAQVRQSVGRAFEISRRSQSQTGSQLHRTVRRSSSRGEKIADTTSAKPVHVDSKVGALAPAKRQVTNITKLQRIGRRMVRPILPPHALSDPISHRLPPTHQWAALGAAGRFYGDGQLAPVKPQLRPDNDTGPDKDSRNRNDARAQPPVWPVLVPSLKTEIETTLDSPLASSTFVSFQRQGVGARLSGNRVAQARTAARIRARGPRETVAKAVGLDMIEKWAAGASATVDAHHTKIDHTGGGDKSADASNTRKESKSISPLSPGTGETSATQQENKKPYRAIAGSGFHNSSFIVRRSNTRKAMTPAPQLVSLIGSKLGALRRQCSSWEQFEDLDMQIFRESVLPPVAPPILGTFHPLHRHGDTMHQC